MARCDKSEHLYRIRAKMFCDATGGTRLGLDSGAELRSGRESAQRVRRIARAGADGQRDSRQQHSFYFAPSPQAHAVQAAEVARKVTKEQLKFRSTASWEYGYWWIEWGGNVDTIRDNERMRFELLSIVMGVWNYIKNSGNHPASEYWALDSVGMMPGKRGSRRLVGDQHAHAGRSDVGAL
jgi:hypothetical protein